MLKNKTSLILLAILGMFSCGEVLIVNENNECHFGEEETATKMEQIYKNIASADGSIYNLRLTDACCNFKEDDPKLLPWTRAHGTDFKIESGCLFQMYNYNDGNKFANSIFQYPIHQNEINLNAANFLEKNFQKYFVSNHDDTIGEFKFQFKVHDEIVKEAKKLKSSSKEITEEQNDELSLQFNAGIFIASNFSDFQNEIKKAFSQLAWARNIIFNQQPEVDKKINQQKIEKLSNEEQIMEETMKKYENSQAEVEESAKKLEELKKKLISEDEIKKLNEDIDKMENSLNISKNIMESNSKFIEFEKNNFNRIKEDVKKYEARDFEVIQNERQKDIERAKNNSIIQDKIIENIKGVLEKLKKEKLKLEKNSSENFFDDNMENNLALIKDSLDEAEKQFGKLQLPEFNIEIINKSSEKQKDQEENASKAQEDRLLI